MLLSPSKNISALPFLQIIVVNKYVPDACVHVLVHIYPMKIIGEYKWRIQIVNTDITWLVIACDFDAHTIYQ